MKSRFKKEDEKFIRDNFENPEQILQMKDLNDVLDEIDKWIDLHGYDKDGFYNSAGMEAQKVYDSIYNMD